jgi:hypothetical protein
MANSKWKTAINVIYILLILDALSHIYEIIKNYNQMDWRMAILKLAFRVATIAAFFYLMRMNANKLNMDVEK